MNQLGWEDNDMTPDGNGAGQEKAQESREANTPRGQRLADYPQGYYHVGPEGVSQALDWQPVLEGMPWHKLDEFLDQWIARGKKQKRYEVLGAYILMGAIVGAATWLASIGVLQGQALSGFLGAAVGYLLSETDIGST